MVQNELRAELRHLTAPQSELVVPSILPTAPETNGLSMFELIP